MCQRHTSTADVSTCHRHATGDVSLSLGDIHAKDSALSNVLLRHWLDIGWRSTIGCLLLFNVMMMMSFYLRFLYILSWANNLSKSLFIMTKRYGMKFDSYIVKSHFML